MEKVTKAAIAVEALGCNILKEITSFVTLSSKRTSVLRLALGLECNDDFSTRTLMLSAFLSN